MTIKDDRKILENLINNSQESIGSTPVSPEDTPEFQQTPSFEINIEKIKRKSIKKAKRMIKNATGIMLTSGMIKENPYLGDKMDMDIISLSGIVYQLEINEIMQASMIQEVRAGNIQARMYEVFATLTKVIGDLNKQLLQTIEAIKMTYKDIKLDIEDKQQELKAIGPNESGLTRNKDGIVAMGTKELIKETKRLKMMQNIEFNNNEISDVQEVNDI